MLYPYLTRLLRKSGKVYTPDAALPSCYILRVLLRRALWLVWGMLRSRRRVFIAPSATIEYLCNISFGQNVSLAPHVVLNAVAKSKVVLCDNVSIGAYSRILCTAHLSHVGKSLTMGEGSSCGEFCIFGAAGGITIGKRVIIGQYVSFHAQEHIFSDIQRSITEQGTTEQGIIVGDDCWIGSKATLLDGTTLGKHCVVAAGAVVKGIFPDYAVIGGVPAKIIRMLND